MSGLQRSQRPQATQDPWLNRFIDKRTGQIDVDKVYAEEGLDGLVRLEKGLTSDAWKNLHLTLAQKQALHRSIVSLSEKDSAKEGRKQVALKTGAATVWTADKATYFIGTGGIFKAGLSLALMGVMKAGGEAAVKAVIAEGAEMAGKAVTKEVVEVAAKATAAKAERIAAQAGAEAAAKAGTEGVGKMAARKLPLMVENTVDGFKVGLKGRGMESIEKWDARDPQVRKLVDQWIDKNRLANDPSLLKESRAEFKKARDGIFKQILAKVKGLENPKAPKVAKWSVGIAAAGLALWAGVAKVGVPLYNRFFGVPAKQIDKTVSETNKAVTEAANAQ